MQANFDIEKLMDDMRNYKCGVEIEDFKLYYDVWMLLRRIDSHTTQLGLGEYLHYEKEWLEALYVLSDYLSEFLDYEFVMSRVKSLKEHAINYSYNIDTENAYSALEKAVEFLMTNGTPENMQNKWGALE